MGALGLVGLSYIVFDSFSPNSQLHLDRYQLGLAVGVFSMGMGICIGYYTCFMDRDGQYQRAADAEQKLSALEQKVNR